MAEVKLKTENFDILRTVAMKFGRTVVDDSLIVPDVKPDIKKVLDVSARSYITDVTPGQDKIYVEGTVKATVLYLPDGDVIGKVKSLDMSREFSCTIEAKGVTADNRITAESETEAPDSTLINSRKINIRIGVNIGVKIYKPEALELPTGTEEGEEVQPSLPVTDLLPFSPRQEKREDSATGTIQFKEMPLRLADKQFVSDGSVILRGQHEISSKLPQIGEVLCANASVEPEEAVCTNGNVRMRGNLKVSVLYEDDSEAGGDKGGAIRTAEFSLPYEEQFDAPKAQDDMECDVEYCVREIYTEIMDNMDGEARILGIEVVVGVIVSGYLVAEPRVIVDAYDAKNNILDLEFRETAPEQLIDSKTAQITHKCTASRRPADSDIGGVCRVTIEKTSVDDVEIKDSTVYVKGSVTVKVLCSSRDENQPLFPIETSTEFEHSFDMPENNSDNVACDAKIFVNHMGYTISGANAVDLRLLIGISVKIAANDRIRTIASIEKTHCDDSEGNGMLSYIIYFVQKGDTLWNIAKRYKTTVEDILNDNDIPDPDNINVGQKIRLVK